MVNITFAVRRERESEEERKSTNQIMVIPFISFSGLLLFAFLFLPPKSALTRAKKNQNKEKTEN